MPNRWQAILTIRVWYFWWRHDDIICPDLDLVKYLFILMTATFQCRGIFAKHDPSFGCPIQSDIWKLGMIKYHITGMRFHYRCIMPMKSYFKYTKNHAVNSTMIMAHFTINEDPQGQVSRAVTSNYSPQDLWDVITCACPWYLLLAHKSTYAQCPFRLRDF